MVPQACTRARADQANAWNRCTLKLIWTMLEMVVVGMTRGPQMR
eukprot:CAMPEP_0179170002 /NCGR_PEP_ID=MMETSP0796-20121207/83721_1 /TAXON_ID=73915 /ORGANISM="Pyrodinium bahamense, Strain pbaha01" /LENGTH=43 /DNA_ID= /DNA_START= /DNA_END= /DNA_ORIENTATION=